MKDEADPGTLEMFGAAPAAGDRELTPVQRRRLKILGTTDRGQEITFQHTVLCQTALPYKNPGDVREWERQQGSVTLKISAGEALDPRTRRFVRLGLPYGSRPRLVLMHLNREALRTRSPRIEVEHSLTAFIRRVLRHAPDGREICRFKDQLNRLAAATVRLGAAVSEDRAVQVTTQIMDVTELWLDKNDQTQRVLWPPVVELSPRYFESLQRHAVPLDERAVAALANAPAALDVYAWLAQRLHRVPSGRGQRISWPALQEQFGQQYGRMDHFKDEFRRTLALVHRHYPAARVELNGQGMKLQRSRRPVEERLALTSRW